ncbi:hypothetical protein C0991_011043 [Blastosporella zonata]|nr:hypothetical protein C0991_011043 [Blastosporella zonata]
MEAKARATGQDCAMNNEPHQALIALSRTDTFAYLASLSASIDRSSDTYVPRHYREALQHLDLWNGPMKAKLDILEKKGVWELVDKTSVPMGKKVINCMTVNGHYTTTNTYGNDILGISSSKEEAERSKKELMEHFKAKDLGELEHLLGMRIKHNKPTGLISLSQCTYLKRVLK